mmetsp:Transcript_7141/g.12808  ORF Transcript_7141/g.12808 Transcript_7141/m.12808 type:complete len:83 (+) Transcript_7141:215-463(+)
MTTDTIFLPQRLERDLHKRDILSRMPVFLVGRRFWQPILDGLQEALLKEDGEFIKCSDLSIMKIIDTTQQDLCDVMERMDCL